MDHLKRFKQSASIGVIGAILLPGIVSAGVLVALYGLIGLDLILVIIISGILYAATTILSYGYILNTTIRPIEMVWQAIWHISPTKHGVAAPKLNTLKIGRELVASIVNQVYDLASNQNSSSNTPTDTPSDLAINLLENIPMAIFILDKDWTIKTANNTAVSYLELEPEKVVGKDVHDVLHISFSSEDTLDSWLNDSVENRATSSHAWDHSKITLPSKEVRQFDMAASYSKDNAYGNEVILALFDRSKVYSVQDQASSYVALAVHELRTPLTMLRGYIELFEEEIGDNLSKEHKEFMNKMSVSAQNLTAFVNNILNVARIDENQFVLSLHEADWAKVLTEFVESLKLRAEVKGKNLHLDIGSDMPTVGIDSISMLEVVSNLVDNAIKYSGQSKDIYIKSILGKEGDVETTVKDSGCGIPESVIGELFTKFYRSHRSKNAVVGSGLGLYLVKSIITAHGGKVWVKSKEDQGSTFGFSLQPFSKISEAEKGKQNTGIERQAGGWIKNHSLYRR